jgi:MFS family permease
MAPVSAPNFLRLYVCFASAYLLSYFYRNVNAVISPELSAELGISASSLGLLTAAYFLAFAAMQLPAGMLLDRYGPRRVEPVLLCIGGCGALAFAASSGLPGLVFARVLIGAGVAVCLMAPLKAIATWYPAERQASLAGWTMVAGGIGSLLATAPLAAALSVLSWRGVFIVLAIATFVAAAAIFLLVPDALRRPQASGLADQWRGVASVFGNPRFWWLAPLPMVSTGSFMAIQGLWSVPWLIEVDGYSREVAARHLLLMGVVILCGYLGLGLFATLLGKRGVTPRHLFGMGFALNIVALTLITTRVPFTYLLWAAYGLGSTVNVLGFTVLSEGFPRELTGRVNTALNLLMFSGSFLAQWGIGVIVDFARSELGTDTAGGLGIAFAVSIGIQLVTYAWFMFGWRRHAATVTSAA